MIDPDFVAEKTRIRRKRYLIDFPLNDLRDPQIDHAAILKKRFMELFGKDAVEFSTVSVQILEENLPANTVELLVTGYVRYFVPSLKKSEDYLG